MASYVRTFMGAAPIASTAAGSLISATGYDRMLVIHVGTVSAQSWAFWNNGSATVPYTTGLAFAAADTRDLGPWFVGSSEQVYGGGVSSSSGWIIAEELRTA